jgi:hypothetical protein
MRRALALLTVLLLSVGASGQTADHLKCYKVKDPQAKATYTADLELPDGAEGIVEPGCTIKVPALMACVAAIKANISPTPPGSGGAGTSNSFLCYKVKCPKVVPPALTGSDQFGSRTLQGKTGSKLVCAPLTGPSTTTTSTSTTTSTTLQGTCSTTGTTCTSDADCGIPGACEPFGLPLCVVTCTTNADCPPPLFCFYASEWGGKGICDGCADDPSNCPIYMTCHRNTCEQTTHPECAGPGSCTIQDRCVF